MKNKNRKNKLYRYAVDTFIKALEQVTGRRKVNYKCNKQDVASWKTFVEEFNDYIGEDFIRKFIEFGFQSWFNDSVKDDKTYKIRFSWVFGKSAVQRWKKNNAEINNIIVQQNLKQNVKINLMNQRSDVPLAVTSLRSVEENFKSEFHNTKRGFLWCIANTTLYFHKSSYCVTCKFKDDCKKLLKQEYFKVFKTRGYGEE